MEPKLYGVLARAESIPGTPEVCDNMSRLSHGMNKLERCDEVQQNSQRRAYVVAIHNLDEYPTGPPSGIQALFNPGPLPTMSVRCSLLALEKVSPKRTISCSAMMSQKKGLRTPAILDHIVMNIICLPR